MCHHVWLLKLNLAGSSLPNPRVRFLRPEWQNPLVQLSVVSLGFLILEIVGYRNIYCLKRKCMNTEMYTACTVVSLNPPPPYLGITLCQVTMVESLPSFTHLSRISKLLGQW
jgi:hypothetical protein